MEHMQENTFWRFPKEQWFKESQNTFCLHELCMFYSYFTEKVLLNQHKLLFSTTKCKASVYVKSLNYIFPISCTFVSNYFMHKSL